MEILIASTNQNKVERIKKLIKAINGGIKIDNFIGFKIQPPLENGRNQKENVIIKLNYYYNQFKKNIIVEDDIIELFIDQKFVPIININNFLKSCNNHFLTWKKFFITQKVTKGRLIKCYGVIINGKTKIRQVVIPLTIQKNSKVPDKNDRNILNNFIGPKIKNKTFVEMTKKERNDFMQEKCLSTITELLVK